MAPTDTELLDPTALTVDELEAEVETGDYTIDELREIRAIERESADPRSTALEAIDEELDALTSGPTEESTTGDDYDRTAVYTLGAGATEQGVPGVNLPDPYSHDAPDSLQIVLDTAMGIAGEMFEESGTHTIEYSMRVKQSLESPTNTARLTQSDPLHPEHGAE